VTRLVADLRFALRLLWRRPGFTVAVVTLLSLGIGATTAMFSLVEAMVWRPLPYPQADQLMVMREYVSFSEFMAVKEHGAGLEAVAVSELGNANLADKGTPAEYVIGAKVSADFLGMLGARAQRGRMLEESDSAPASPRVAVISARLWRDRFGADPQMVGRVVFLDGVEHSVVGVLADGFRFVRFAGQGDVWTPLRVGPPGDPRRDRARSLALLMRRKSDVRLEEARIRIMAAGIKEVTLRDLRAALSGDSRDAVWILFAAVAFVHLVVSANVANLLLTHAASRRGEMALRVALGATRARLIRQLVAEATLQFLLASVAGFALAHGLVDRLSEVILDGEARTIPHPVDVQAFAFSVGTCLLLGMLIGLGTGLATSAVMPQSALKEAGARVTGSGSHARARTALVVLQIALAVSLLIGAGLMVRYFVQVATTTPGFEPKALATATVQFSGGTTIDKDRLDPFYRAVLARLAAEPGVVSVGATTALPMGPDGYAMTLPEVEGRAPPAPDSADYIEQTSVTPGYFRTLRLPILRGRDFTEADVRDGTPVMIINQRTAERYFPGEDPIGRRMRAVGAMAPSQMHEIVGVVGNLHQLRLGDPIHAATYLPFAQGPKPGMSVVARAENPEVVLRALPELVRRVKADQAVTEMATMEQLMADRLQQGRWFTALALILAVTALVLASVGLYGLVSHSTAQRTRELGIRMALGATREAVAGLVLREGLVLTAGGLALGIGGGFAIGRVLAQHIAGVTAFDRLVYLAIPALLGLASVVACAAPAWRAVRVAPASALRYE